MLSSEPFLYIRDQIEKKPLKLIVLTLLVLMSFELDLVFALALTSREKIGGF